MDIDYSNKRIEEASLSLAKASKLFGVPVGRKFIQRIGIIRASDKFGQLFGIQALRLHPLKGNRSGQFSMMLTANYRMIIERIQEDRILIVDVEDYHGK